MKYKDVRFSIINEYKKKLPDIFNKYWDEVYDLMISKEDIYQDLYLMYDVIETYVGLAIENKEKQYRDDNDILRIPVEEAYCSEIWNIFTKYLKEEYVDHLPIVITLSGPPNSVDITGIVATLSRDLSQELKDKIILLNESFEFELVMMLADIIKRYLSSQKEYDKCTNELQKFLYSDTKKFRRECIYIRDEYIEGLAESESEMYSVLSLLTEDSFLLDKPKESTKVKYKNIFDPKEMIKLAEHNGFKYIRSKGDHDIYRNKTGAITIIPQHDLGKGLSIAIQKQIMKGVETSGKV